MYNFYDEATPDQGFMNQLGTTAVGQAYRAPVINPLSGGLGNQILSSITKWFPGGSGGNGGNIWGSLLGKTDTKTGIKTDGWGGLALGAAQGMAGAYLGMKQYGMAKQQLAESKRQFNVNYEAQRKSVNTAMEDRQAARVASNPEAYESVGSYMNKNRI